MGEKSNSLSTAMSAYSHRILVSGLPLKNI